MTNETEGLSERHGFSYDRIPSKMRSAAHAYVERGRIPGDFLQAALADSLTRAWGRADKENRAHMQEWVWWLYNDIPGECWGSKEAIKGWAEDGGLEGRYPELAEM